MTTRERGRGRPDLLEVSERVAAIGLGPLLLAQGLWVRARIPRLAEPEGPREGRAGQGPLLRLLVLGDSAAAGVGAPHQSAALAGRLVARLSRHATVDWLLCARTGATTESTCRTLSELPARQFDVAVTSLGVNDAIAGTPIGRWRQDQRALREQLKTSFRVESILVSGLPPVSQFPALPQPLRWFLGRRCRALDGALARDVADDPMSAYLPLDFLSDVEWMAEDGFHPGPVIYDAWAGELASRIISGA